ncbi:hypothetical protein LENED_008429 [Lentinula edodes]|uniref:F-box domain-containing protein n=1 Tax=Lentinula edodes TaxID=5353 RepID=A0A1Q3EH45_LENED|nr:hypothetical protein LENED_008429 [Lentinula edodes]
MEVMQAKLSTSLFRRPSDQHSPKSPENRRRDPCAEHRFKALPPAHRSSATSYTSTHSIRNLPPELLAYIFVLGCEDDPMLPLSVSHVCSFWRALALSTPVLWRRVVLGSHYSMWEETMYRARGCTLDIEFKPQNHRGPLAFYEVQRYMHLVMPHITRWRSLSIVFSEYQPYTQVPGLEELCLVYRHNDDTKEFCLFSGHRGPANGWYTEDSVVFLSRVENLRWLVLRRGCSDVVHWLDPDIQRSAERK